MRDKCESCGQLGAVKAELGSSLRQKEQTPGLWAMPEVAPLIRQGEAFSAVAEFLWCAEYLAYYPRRRPFASGVAVVGSSGHECFG